jgi:hypothetical protein
MKNNKHMAKLKREKSLVSKQYRNAELHNFGLWNQKNEKK